MGRVLAVGDTAVDSVQSTSFLMAGPTDGWLTAGTISDSGKTSHKVCCRESSHALGTPAPWSPGRLSQGLYRLHPTPGPPLMAPRPAVPFGGPHSAQVPGWAPFLFLSCLADSWAAVALPGEAPPQTTGCQVCALHSPGQLGGGRCDYPTVWEPAEASHHVCPARAPCCQQQARAGRREPPLPSLLC